MSSQLVLATRNAHKLAELAEILGGAGVDVALLPLPPDAPDVVEDGLTFARIVVGGTAMACPAT